MVAIELIFHGVIKVLAELADAALYRYSLFRSLAYQKASPMLLSWAIRALILVVPLLVLIAFEIGVDSGGGDTDGEGDL